MPSGHQKHDQSVRRGSSSTLNTAESKQHRATTHDLYLVVPMSFTTTAVRVRLSHLQQGLEVPFASAHGVLEESAQLLEHLCT